MSRSSVLCKCLCAGNKTPFQITTRITPGLDASPLPAPLTKDLKSPSETSRTYELGAKVIRSSSLLVKGTPSSSSLTMTSLNSLKKAWSSLA